MPLKEWPFVNESTLCPFHIHVNSHELPAQERRVCCGQLPLIVVKKLFAAPIL